MSYSVNRCNGCGAPSHPDHRCDSRALDAGMLRNVAEGILTLSVDGHRPTDLTLSAICGRAAATLDEPLLSVFISTPSSAAPGLVAGTNAEAEALAHLELVHGEGPALDAINLKSPVLIENLSNASARWPMHVRGALDQNVAAAFAFPLGLHAEPLGALVLYHETPGPLLATEQARARIAAETVFEILVRAQAVAQESETLSAPLAALAEQSDIIDVAAGILAVRLALTVEDAALLLRAHAYSRQLTLHQTATAIVAGTLQLPAP